VCAHQTDTFHFIFTPVSDSGVCQHVFPSICVKDQTNTWTDFLSHCVFSVDTLLLQGDSLDMWGVFEYFTNQGQELTILGPKGHQI